MGLVAGEPLSLPYYRDPRVKRRLKELSETMPITHVFVYSSAMAQYAMHPLWDRQRRVIDFVDADSDKWRQYASGLRGPMRWIYNREARLLEIADRTAAEAFDVSIFVSAAEAAWFRDRVCLHESRVTSVSNGVDTSYFDPDRDYASPYLEGQRPVVFTGAMDYWANVDAVTWFTRDVWPRVCALDPHAVFYIVGARPTAAVRALAAEWVLVTGRVPDVRPYLRHAAVVVAPMRIARGVQNKVLEAMSMAKAPVVTSKALEGIGAVHGRELLVADDTLQLAHQVLRVLDGSCAALGPAARSFVRKHYSWHESCETLVRLLEGTEKTDAKSHIARRYAN
jgi:sugar transferase (PEP-CTERM/EpsH1 system associated)